MPERKSMKRFVSDLSPKEEAFAKEGNISSNIARNIATLPEEKSEGRWITVTFKLPPGQIEQLSAISTARRLKGKTPWKKQEILSEALATWLAQDKGE